jgi:integrase
MKTRPRGTGSIFREEGCDRWRIQYFVDGRRYRKNTHSKDRSIAQKMLTQILNDINHSQYQEEEFKPVRVEDLYQHMLHHVSNPYELNKRWRHLSKVFGPLVVTRVTTDRILEYRQARKADKAADATVNRELATLKRMFRLGQQATPPKVAVVPHFPMFRENNVRRGFVEDADYARLTAHAGELWMRTLLELGFTYGWRKQELLSLRVRQLNFAKLTIRLDVGSTKNHEGREVKMTATVATLLRQCAVGKHPEDHVLRREDGHPVRDFRHAWKQLTSAAGRPGLLVHDLRRSAAKALRAAGVPESVVMSMGGWKTAAMFRRYAIVSSADQVAAVEALEKARNSNSPAHSPDLLQAETAVLRKPQ